MGYMSMKECLENQATEKVLMAAVQKDSKKASPETEFEHVFN